MHRIRFYIFGKVKETYLLNAYDEYLKRLSKFAKTEIIYLKEESLDKDASKTEIEKALLIEANDYLSRKKADSSLILIDLHGKEFDSIAFSNEFNKVLESNIDIDILIGSSNGLADILREKANLRVSLSKMTTTHPLALLFTLEQIYRSFKIINNQTYHK